jgi:hypothetical protein
MLNTRVVEKAELRYEEPASRNTTGGFRRRRVSKGVYRRSVGKHFNLISQPIGSNTKTLIKGRV